jgi:hypothetical protein
MIRIPLTNGLLFVCFHNSIKFLFLKYHELKCWEVTGLITFIDMNPPKTRRSGKNWQPTFLWSHTDRIENDGSNSSSLPREGVQSRCLATIRGYTRHTLPFDTTRTAQKTMRPTILLLLVFVDLGTCLPSPCSAMVGRGGYTYRHKVMEGINEVCRWDRLRCHDIHTKFHTDWFRHSKFGGYTYR